MSSEKLYDMSYPVHGAVRGRRVSDGLGTLIVAATAVIVSFVTMFVMVRQGADLSKMEAQLSHLKEMEAQMQEMREWRERLDVQVGPQGPEANPREQQDGAGRGKSATFLYGAKVHHPAKRSVSNTGCLAGDRGEPGRDGRDGVPGPAGPPGPPGSCCCSTTTSNPPATTSPSPPPTSPSPPPTTTPVVFPTPEPCDLMPDLFFVLDGSGSVGSENFNTVKQFVAAVASAFNIGLTQTRVGVVQYSTSSVLECNLGDHPDQSSFDSAISTLTYQNGGYTNTGAALDFARQNAAWRPAPVPRIMVVLTDGKSRDSVVTPSQDLAADGVTVFAIGVGNFVHSELLQITNNNPGRVFELADFNSLAQNITQIVRALCTPGPCSPTVYRVLNETWRNVNHGGGSHCDSGFNGKWYRFMGPAGTQMPTQSPTRTRICGTRYPMWMNGAHPTDADGEVSRQACAFWGRNSCRYQATIQVKACRAGYYVYKLPRVPRCTLTYCGETDPCSPTVYRVLNETWRNVNYYDDGYNCDSGFNGEWYRFMGPAGTQMPTQSPTSARICDTAAPMWMNGTHPTAADGEVSRQACGYYSSSASCRWSTTIQVKACRAGYYVYKLPRAPTCNLAYCGETV